MNIVNLKYGIITLFVLLFFITSPAQLPTPALVGYYHNWHTPSAPFIPLDQVPQQYNVVVVAFALPQPGTDYQMEFTPYQLAPTTFHQQIQSLQAQGTKVLISIGGATAPITLSSLAERDSFIASMTQILFTYGFDGMDLDLEGTSLAITGGTITSPIDWPILHLIEATKQLMAAYSAQYGKKLLLTMAPETAHVQGGQSSFGGLWGSYLPVIHALRDSLDLLQVQLYNSGSMYGIDGNVYTQGTPDFIVALTEAVITGFNTSGGFFDGLPVHKVAVALPACTAASGGGFLDTTQVKLAMDYLMGLGPAPGNYSLQNTAAYPQLGGMMTWSINWDATPTCSTPYAFARNFQRIFSPIHLANPILTSPTITLKLLQAPHQTMLQLKAAHLIHQPVLCRLYSIQGQLCHQQTLHFSTDTYNHPLPPLPPGIYLAQLLAPTQTITTKLHLQ